MAQQTINIGAAPNDGTGDTLRDAGDKINDNFTELYGLAGGTSVFALSAYGALGDGIYLADGVATNGDATFTSATAAFAAGDIGKVIEITSGANVFKTTIASINSGTSIELTAPPSFSASGCDVYYGTDDTDAIQDCFDAAGAALGGIIEADRAIYIINGPLQDTSRSNAQILLPRRHVLNDEQISIALHGAIPPPTAFSVIGSAPVQHHHTIFKSTLNSGSGTTPSVFGAWGPSGSSDNFTHLHFEGRNFAVRCPSNPVLSGMNLSRVASVDLDETVADVGYSAVADLTEPTTSTSIGIALPTINNGACVRLGTVNVIGFYTGYWHSEHALFLNVNAWGCKRTVELVAANFSSKYVHLGSYHCQSTICPTGAHVLEHGSHVSIEHAASGTWAPVFDLDDASGFLAGDLEWWSVLGGTGPHDVFTFNGGSTNLRLRQAGRPDGRIITLTGTAHTASLAENYAFVRFTNGSAVTYTLPQDSAVNFPVGSTIEVVQAGAGPLSFAAGTGATVNSRSSDLTLAGQYAVAFAKKVAANTWTVNGDL